MDNEVIYFVLKEFGFGIGGFFQLNFVTNDVEVVAVEREYSAKDDCFGYGSNYLGH